MTYEQLIDQIMEGVAELDPSAAALTLQRLAGIPGALDGWAMRQIEEEPAE